MTVPPHPELPAAVQTCSMDMVVCETTFALSINRKAASPRAVPVRQREAIPFFLEERMPVPVPAVVLLLVVSCLPGLGCSLCCL